MAAANFLKGQTARLVGKVIQDDTLITPDNFHLHIEKPDGTTSAETMVEEETGVYSFNLHLDQQGTWKYCFGGTGDDAGLAKGEIVVGEGCTITVAE